jgi:hypothetical protein
MKPTVLFREWIETELPPWHIGEIEIEPGYFLRHTEKGNSEKRILSLAELRDFLKVDEQGNFRPLRAAPNLKNGWIYGPLPFPDLVEALNFIYPAAIAHWAYQQSGQLPVVSYDVTASRQTGRYKNVGDINRKELDALSDVICRESCLRTRLWGGGSAEPIIVKKSTISIPCPEVCNYFIDKVLDFQKAEFLSQSHGDTEFSTGKQ